MPAITTADRARFQIHLATALRSPALNLDSPETQGDTAQIRVGVDVLNMVDQVDEEGKRSWVVTLVVLAEYLA